MAWLLLQHNAPPEHANDPPVTAVSSTSRRDAWVLLGNLGNALYQAGYVSELLARGKVPLVIVGAGMGALNAVLASTGKVQTFVKGWERLRARHFIMAAALEENGSFAARRIVGPDTVAGTARHGASFVTPATRILLASGERFTACDASEGSRPMDLVDRALRRIDVEPDTVASAIAAASVERPDIIHVWGADQWTASSPLVLKALDSIPETRVHFIAPDPVAPPSLLELLLPGSGAVERTMSRGRRAAGAYLTESVD